MNQPKTLLDWLKLAGSIVIVLAAACIMLPGFVGLALGLLRILVMLVVAGGACLLIAKATRRLTRGKPATDAAALTTSAKSDSTPAT